MGRKKNKSYKRRRIRKTPRRPELSVELILAWADSYFALARRWPNIHSGRIMETVDDTWKRVDDALRNGYRGIPGKPQLSLARVLEKFRGVRNSEYPPKLTVAQIVKWAKAHYRLTEHWPNDRSGPITALPSHLSPSAPSLLSGLDVRCNPYDDEGLTLRFGDSHSNPISQLSDELR